jgi:outer membrane receptor protein involved in Fe transport
MRLLFFILLFVTLKASAQEGVIGGTVLDDKNKPLESATVQIALLGSASFQKTSSSDGTGGFLFSGLPMGYYRLIVSYVGLQNLAIDSIYLRPDRYDFQLGELIVKPKETAGLNEIIIYAEKPLIQSKDGNITFNVSESATSQGSNASDLLTQVPLVSKDADGKVTVRGKEPKILIDDKPVEMNAQQLQDFLESLPGNAIEKIEVMTNPPPQYANEQGGVINIVTRKGTVGFNGRLNVFVGTRGEKGSNAHLTYRKTGLSININGGISDNDYRGMGYSVRQNLYADSSNVFKTSNQYNNSSLRPSFRASVDYEFTKEHQLNFVAQINQNQSENTSTTEFRNINRFAELYRLSNRSVGSRNRNNNSNLNLNYTFRGQRPGEVLRVFTSYWSGGHSSDRRFYQQFFHPDYTPTGYDSTNQLINSTENTGYNVRIAYDRPIVRQKTFLSVGSYFTHSASDVRVDASYKNKLDGTFSPLDLQSNFFLFYQDITNFRLSVKQVFQPGFSATAGLSEEQTAIRFDLLKAGKDTANRYWTLLPFFNLNKTWGDVNLSVSYRKSIRRPGVNELNPTRDYSDPFNTRGGNPGLLPSTADNFDLVIGRSKNALYTNLGLGYNRVHTVFSPIRTLLGDGTTETIWQNISGKREYEASMWSGYTVARKLRLNISASYVYNRYSDYDKQFRRYRDAGSFTSNLNVNYTYKQNFTTSGNVSFNRFANPQGVARSTVNTNIGFQARLLNRKLTLALNMTDPFFQLRNRNYTYGPNFILENFNNTQTRNFRLSVGYGFSKTTTKRQTATEKAVQNLIKS